MQALGLLITNQAGEKQKAMGMYMSKGFGYRMGCLAIGSMDFSQGIGCSMVVDNL